MKRSITTRAHGSQEKAQRRSAILQAADRLFSASRGELPTAAEIAAETGLAKGTVYLYFQTKEEIFAALLLEQWGDVMQHCQQVLRETKGARIARVAAFVTSLVLHLEAHPGLLRLDALAYGVLERNLEREVLIAHKAEYAKRLEATGSVVDTAFRLPAGRGLQLLMRTYALTSGLWQSYAHAAETVRAGGNSKGIFPSAPFGKELHEALSEYWRGELLESASAR